MTKARLYPLANHTVQWWENSFSRGRFTTIQKILLHTTETPSWPDYKGGSEAPTLTYDVVSRKWRQHNYLDTSARALGDPTSTPVRENRDNVIQIEMIWYAAKAAQLPTTAYQDIAAFVAFVRKEWGGPPLVSATFVGEALAPKAHMSSLQYDAFSGLLGHQHAPLPSTHWDPGAIDGNRILYLVKNLETPVVPTVPPAATVKNTLSADTDTTIRRNEITLYSRLDVATAKGTCYFEYLNAGTGKWLPVDSGSYFNGHCVTVNKPWSDVTYRSRFVSADRSKWTDATSNAIVVRVLQPSELAKLLPPRV